MEPALFLQAAGPPCALTHLLPPQVAPHWPPAKPARNNDTKVLFSEEASLCFGWPCKHINSWNGILWQWCQFKLCTESHRLPEGSSGKDEQKLCSVLCCEGAELVTGIQAARADAVSTLREGIPGGLHMDSFHHVSLAQEGGWPSGHSCGGTSVFPSLFTVSGKHIRLEDELVESESGSRAPSGTAHRVFAQAIWSTQNTCYHIFCSFQSSLSCFKSSRNCFEILSPSRTQPQHIPNPIFSADLALTSSTPVPRLRPSRVGTAPLSPGHHPELVRPVHFSSPRIQDAITRPMWWTLPTLVSSESSSSEMLNAILDGSGTGNLRSYLTHIFGSWDIMKTDL